MGECQASSNVKSSSLVNNLEHFQIGGGKLKLMITKSPFLSKKCPINLK